VSRTQQMLLSERLVGAGVLHHRVLRPNHLLLPPVLRRPVLYRQSNVLRVHGVLHRVAAVLRQDLHQPGVAGVLRRPPLPDRPVRG
jgi:hypothetical protein